MEKNYPGTSTSVTGLMKTDRQIANQTARRSWNRRGGDSSCDQQNLPGSWVIREFGKYG